MRSSFRWQSIARQERTYCRLTGLLFELPNERYRVVLLLYIETQEDIQERKWDKTTERQLQIKIKRRRYKPKDRQRDRQAKAYRQKVKKDSPREKKRRKEGVWRKGRKERRKEGRKD